jgi:hypothetical protein
MHGGSSTGPKTAEGLARIRAARTTHGMRTAEMEQMRALVRAAGYVDKILSARGGRHA